MCVSNLYVPMCNNESYQMNFKKLEHKIAIINLIPKIIHYSGKFHLHLLKKKFYSYLYLLNYVLEI